MLAVGGLASGSSVFFYLVCVPHWRETKPASPAWAATASSEGCSSGESLMGTAGLESLTKHCLGEEDSAQALLLTICPGKRSKQAQE